MSKAIASKIIVAVLVLFLLAGIAYAADAKDQSKDVSVDTGKDVITDDKTIDTSKDTVKNETIVDKTKETSKNIDTGIKVKDTTSSLASYKVTKEKDKITVSKPDESKGHTKTILTLDKTTAQSIDVDKDNKFSVSRWVDGQFLSSKIVTLGELTAGTEVVFSDTIVGGLTGTYSVTYQTAIGNSTKAFIAPNASVITVEVPSVGTYMAWNESNKSTYPKSSNLVVAYPLNGNANDISGNARHGTVSSVTWNSTYASFNGSGGINFAMPFLSRNQMSYVVFFSEYTTKTLTGTDATNYRTYYDLTNIKSYNVIGGAGANRLLGALSVSPGVVHKFVHTYDGSATDIYIDNTKYRYSASGNITNGASMGLGKYGTNSDKGTAKMHSYALYNIGLNESESNVFLKGFYGSSIKFNSTGILYPLYSSSQSITPPASVTSINLLSNTNETKNVTYTAYYTLDTTLVSDTHTSTQQTVNITHSTPATMDSGTLLPYPILDGYDGTASMTSNNANATISRNETHFTISTGYMPANQTYYYLVEIPNPIEEITWSDWNPSNQTCNVKITIGNSTPYTVWNITTTNVTNGNVYSMVYAGNKTEVGHATASNGQATILITGLADGVYWLTETSSGFVNVPAVAVIVTAAGAFIGGSFISSWYRKRKAS